MAGAAASLWLLSRLAVAGPPSQSSRPLVAGAAASLALGRSGAVRRCLPDDRFTLPSAGCPGAGARPPWWVRGILALRRPGVGASCHGPCLLPRLVVWGAIWVLAHPSPGSPALALRRFLRLLGRTWDEGGSLGSTSGLMTEVPSGAVIFLKVSFSSTSLLSGMLSERKL